MIPIMSMEVCVKCRHHSSPAAVEVDQSRYIKLNNAYSDWLHEKTYK